MMLTKQTPPMKVAILGGKSVGKTAISVRYLTKRYIGEYNSNTDHLYQCPITCPQMKGNIQLLDITGDCLKKNEEEMKEIICWANGLVLVYSVCDRNSFNLIHKMLNDIARISPQTTVILVGNKQDLEPGRAVEYAEGKTLATQYTAQFFEISAADQSIGVSRAFESLLQKVAKSPRVLNKNQLILCSYCNNISRHQKMAHERIVSPFQLLGSVLSATQRKYSFPKKNKLVKHSLSSQSTEIHHEKESLKAVKNRSHSAPQFFVQRRKEQTISCNESSFAHSPLTTG